MEKAEFSYREIAPTAGLEPYILSFWEFSVGPELDGSIDFEIFPDGCSSLFYYRNTARKINAIGITGLNLETVKRPVFAGDTISYRVTIMEKIDLKSRPERGMLVFLNEGFNQKDELVYQVTGQILVPRRIAMAPAQ